MKKILFTAILLATTGAFSQVGIGTTDPKGALDIVSSTGGLIIPRVADHTTLTVAAAQTGMQVYNTTTKSVWLWDGTVWVENADGTDKSKWTNDATNTRVALTNLSDGTTARPAGTEFVVTDAGNVGIGTTTPTAQLQIGEGTGEQGIKVYGGDSSQKYLTLGTSWTDRWSIVSNGLDNSFLLYGNHTADGNGIKLPFLITKYGRVGIGNNINDVINDIYSDLQVGRGALGTSGHIVIHGGNDSQAALSLGTSSTDRWHIISQPNNSLTIGEDHSSDGGQTEANITINPGGNVGIGTSTPTAKLDVAGSIKMVDGNQGAGKLMVSDAAGKATWTDASTAISGALSGAGADTTADAWVENTGNTVVSSGNVGVGTTTPTEKLEVIGNTKISGGISVNGGNASYSGIGYVPNNLDPANDLDAVDRGAPQGGGVLRLNGHTGISLSAHPSYGGIRFYSQGYGASQNPYNPTEGAVLAMTVVGSMVGIGTAAPTTRLQVVGLPGYASDAAAGAGGLTAGAFYQTSGHATLPNGVIMVKQ